MRRIICPHCGRHVPPIEVDGKPSEAMGLLEHAKTMHRAMYLRVKNTTPHRF